MAWGSTKSTAISILFNYSQNLLTYVEHLTGIHLDKTRSRLGLH